jgi:glycosyltransferase-like protein
MSRPDRSLRIALFTYATQPRGGVLHALALGEALQALGHHVVLYALAHGGREFIREPRCPYVLIPVDGARGDTLTFVRDSIAAYLAHWSAHAPAFDIYHAHDGISANALATLVERGTIPHFTRTVHHLDDFGERELAALQDRSIVRAQHCLVVSHTWRERLRNAYGRDSTVVPNGVDANRFTPLEPAARERLRTRLGYGTGPLFVTIGGIEARKNTQAILAAFAHVQRSVSAARLVIAGGASVLDHSRYRETFDARVVALGLTVGREIEITGVLTDAQIVDLLRAANAFVFPSLVEGFGLVVLEALACGTPVVTAAIPPFTEFLTDDDALLVDPHDVDALANALRAALDPMIATRAAVRGPQLARRFTWKNSAHAHVAAYGAFLAQQVGVGAHA